MTLLMVKKKPVGHCGPLYGPVWNEGIQNAGIGKNAGIRYDEK